MPNQFSSMLGGPIGLPVNRLNQSYAVSPFYRNAFGSAFTGSVDPVNKTFSASGEFPIGAAERGNRFGFSAGKTPETGYYGGFRFSKVFDPLPVGAPGQEKFSYGVDFGGRQENNMPRMAGQSFSIGPERIPTDMRAVNEIQGATDILDNTQSVQDYYRQQWY